MRYCKIYLSPSHNFYHTDQEEAEPAGILSKVIPAHLVALEALMATAEIELTDLIMETNYTLNPEDKELAMQHGIAKFVAPGTDITLAFKELFDSQYKKFDNGKLRYDLIPPSALHALASVLTFGAQKYGDNNWKKMPKDELYRTIGAAMRHMDAYRSGEKLDPESGLPHLYHLMANIAFLVELDNDN